jgi:hypothetical protein
VHPDEKKDLFFIIILRQSHYGHEQRKKSMTNMENDGEECNAAYLGKLDWNSRGTVSTDGKGGCVGVLLC